MITKAREFWLEISPMIEREIHNEKPRDIFPHNRIVHVIEYSAYEELKRQNEIMAEAIKDFLDCSGGIDPNDERLGWLREALAKCGKITNKD